MVHGVSSLMRTSVKIWCSLIGAERPRTSGWIVPEVGADQPRLGRTWGGSTGADRLWSGSSVSLLDNRQVNHKFIHSFIFV